MKRMCGGDRHTRGASYGPGDQPAVRPPDQIQAGVARRSRVAVRHSSTATVWGEGSVIHNENESAAGREEAAKQEVRHRLPAAAGAARRVKFVAELDDI
jgi:hypothetical protein